MNGKKKRFYGLPRLNREQSDLSLRVLMYKDRVGRKKGSRGGGGGGGKGREAVGV